MVAPTTLSAGAVRFRCGRFQRATTKITPINDIAFTTNAVPTPKAAMSTPARPGPIARARLNSIPLSADAASKSSFATSSGKTARHVGVSNASPADSANVRASNSHGEINPVMTSAANAIATDAIQISVKRISLRRSQMSPSAPAGQSEQEEWQRRRRLGERDIHWPSLE